MKMSLSEEVYELEESYEAVRAELRNAEERCSDMEEQLDDVEQDLETTIQQRNKLQEFYDWAKEVYPEIVRDFNSVKVIEEMANGL
jgi:predicted  nucleic acid-binding Zn-ribbon protein